MYTEGRFDKVRLAERTTSYYARTPETVGTTQHKNTAESGCAT